MSFKAVITGLLVILSGFLSPTFAQQVTADDTLSVITTDSTFAPEKVRRHSPRRAAIQSAILPGWGQVYNKKYWKVPVFYAGFAGLGYAIGYNASNWNTYRNAYRLRLDGDSTTIDEFAGAYSANDLKTLKDFYKRNLDISVIFTAVLYTLNIIDATVDAHLFEFDVSDDLTMRVQPVIQYNAFRPENSLYTGVAVNLRLCR